MTPWTRIKNDVNGNPRHVISWLDLEPAADRTLSQEARYTRVLRAANAVGGRRYTGKGFGGGIVFQAYECQLQMLADRVRAALAAATQEA